MGKIVVSQNVTLDGVVEDPSGERVCGTMAGRSSSWPGLGGVGRPGAGWRHKAPRRC